jgi:hypothetical protein
MIRSVSLSKVLLVLCVAILARGPASAADTKKVDAAKRFLTNVDRSKLDLCPFYSWLCRWGQAGEQHLLERASKF